MTATQTSRIRLAAARSVLSHCTSDEAREMCAAGKALESMRGRKLTTAMQEWGAALGRLSHRPNLPESERADAMEAARAARGW